MIGAAVAARLRVRDPLRLVGVTLLVIAVPAALLAVAPSVPIAVMLVATIGAGRVTVEVVVDTSLARRLGETVLARAYGLAYPAGIAAGSLITAPPTGWLGLAGALVVVGALVEADALGILLPAMTWWPVRPVRLVASGPSGKERIQRGRWPDGRAHPRNVPFRRES
ncbi:hypothetical protein Raf01_45280 [Rugosimonospora africana]|uniref:Transmembrane secretion effector n=1 Tax=Rugosimonospora africana TaxID=556532 RepID=A0A8J3QX72_9ACTN|nr:hypothetical protein Raf01_45280 [Rugosimonospora africana]